MIRQRTLKDSFTLKSKGLHTGLHITATFNPAPANHGLKIQRVDLEEKPVVDCDAKLVGDTQRGTVLVKDNIKISTIEHAMAALYAAGVDNCLIQLDGPEMPILDGSALYWTQSIEKVGTVEQDAEKDFYVVDKVIEVEGKNGERVKIEPCDHFCLEVTTDFGTSVLGKQTATLDDCKDFSKEISSARTFVFVREIEPLLNMGLIKGGDLGNAIVIYEIELSQERFDALTDKLGVSRMNAKQLGFLNPKPLTWNNETTRHKLLDIIGDLALIGRPLIGKVTAYKPGHAINNMFARAILNNM
ncbi:MAG: UDP-3-O-[3-hydroxymyristoyl] N-acetylglucosamine deacetylase [Bacteroidaceae bacterium]|nr:UDP-3-O-[3-hydroxymyristoyl] N-acetylglucosamine deacetylase [Bacteroidaceae bacterium]